METNLGGSASADLERRASSRLQASLGARMGERRRPR